MATPLTLAQITTTYDKWHVRYKVYAGAGTRGRPGGITDAIGEVEHHTGGGSASASYLYFLFITGRPADGIPGPLCNEATDSGGTVHIGAVGRANHAGMGSSTTRDKIRSESYPGFTSEISPGPDNVNGNPLYYGNEWIYSGTVPPTAAQYRGAALAAAARFDAHGWSALSALAHREHTRRKNDPFGVNMAQFRRDVAAILKAGPAATVNYVATGKLAVPTVDTPTTQEGNDMGTWTEAQLRAMMQAEEEEYAIRFWVDSHGTGTAMRNLQQKMNLQLDRIENAIAALPSNNLQPLELNADGLSPLSQELVGKLEDSVNTLGARPAAAQLQAFLNADGTLDDAPMEAPKSTGPTQGTA